MIDRITPSCFTSPDSTRMPSEIQVVIYTFSMEILLQFGKLLATAATMVEIKGPMTRSVQCTMLVNLDDVVSKKHRH